MKKKGELIISIHGIDFFDGGTNGNGFRLVYTQDENFHIPINSEIKKECNRIYGNFYESYE